MQIPDFEIKNNGEISQQFLMRNIFSFHNATKFIKDLKYGRNKNKEHLKIVFAEKKGTCSTKHAVLKKLAEENGFDDIELMLGIFKMNGKNTPKVENTLHKNNLDYIPEAHNYLKFRNVIFDFTRTNSKASDFDKDLLLETLINPDEISKKKVEIHQEYLKKWLTENKQIKMNFEDLWKIREQCIEDLSS